MSELLTLHNRLASAGTAEEIFGTLTGTTDEMLAQMKRTFRAMALVAHPDRTPAMSELAEKTFNLLETWRGRAEARIRAGDYGKATPSMPPIVTRRGTYVLGDLFARGDYYTLYRCTRSDRAAAQELTFKIVRQACDNDLLEREAEILRDFAAPDTRGRAYFPELIDTFLSADGKTQRRAVILGTTARTVPLTALRAAYPAGLDPRDAAWIFNRLLEGLWFTHQRGLVHGAVLPANLWVDVKRHGLVLADWASAVTSGETIAVISGSHAEWYPGEVPAKTPATAGTDIFMAARCLVYLLGGDPLTGDIPPTVPARLQRFIKGCLIPWAARRPSDAGVLREEFDECLRQLYGKRTFRPLAVPA